MFDFLSSLSIWGTVVNTLGVILGALLGIVIKHFSRPKAKENGGETFSSQISDAIMKGVALCVLLIGITGAITTADIMVVIISMVIGVVVGTLLNLDKGISSLGNLIERKTGGKLGSITQGFVTASLLFCVGAMAIVGSLDSGLSGNHATLYAKSLLDAIAATIFATTLGWGVVFSSLLVFVYHGAITLAASWIAPVLSEAVITEMTAVGSLLIIALALNMLGLTKIKVMNYVPAIFAPIFILPLMQLLN